MKSYNHILLLPLSIFDTCVVYLQTLKTNLLSKVRFLNLRGERYSSTFTQFSHFSCSSSYLNFRLSCGIISFISKMFLLEQVWWWHILWISFHLIINFSELAGVFFCCCCCFSFAALEMIVPTAFWLPWFLMKSPQYSKGYSLYVILFLVCNMYFFL